MPDELRAELARVTAENVTLQEAIRWALGEVGDFPPCKQGQGAYWWRTELRARAALSGTEGT